MRLCIVKPNRDAYSETFIHRQIKELKPCRVLYEGWYPTVEATSNRSFLPFPFGLKVFRGSFRRLAPDLYHRFYTRQFSEYLKKSRVDVVLANYGPMGVRTVDACDRAGVPLVVHFHGFDAYHYPSLEEFGKYYPSMFSKAAALVVVSRDMEAKLLSMGASAEKIWYNPFGVDAEVFTPVNPASSPPLFVFVGRFTGKKDPRLLLRSFRKVLDKVPDARLLLIGDGGLLGPSKDLATELNLGEHVTFAGSLAHEKVAQALTNARAFVQHSLTSPDGDKEGTPNTILEASCSALPVISTSHAGIKEAVLHEKTGFLVDEGDWEGMAQYMIKIAQDPDLAQEMGKAGRQHMMNSYSLSRQFATFSKIFQTVLS